MPQCVSAYHHQPPRPASSLEGMASAVAVKSTGVAGVIDKEKGVDTNSFDQTDKAARELH